MRGKVSHSTNGGFQIRITPAYAGKSGGNVMSQMAYTDHPRLCGEKLESDAILGENAGSPPPMRGKERDRSGRQSHHRITPAYAGKSQNRYNKGRNDEDHPRLCGEKLLFDTDAAYGVRITPAYAGKSASESPRKAALQDHPRLCGEKFILPHVDELLLGSPPPMRGKAVIVPEPYPECRITPAYAGKSQRQLHTQGRCQDHPRLCGEKGTGRGTGGHGVGSPPPMRGKAHWRIA